MSTSPLNDLSTIPAWTAFLNREDLSEYTDSNAYAIFVAQLKLGFDDVSAFADRSITDGSNDKSCDLVHVSRDDGHVIIAQCYRAQDTQKPAKSKKAADLNTAVSWVLAGDLETVPERLRSASLEVREALKAGDIEQFHIWYIHNQNETEDIEAESRQACQTADSLIRTNFPDIPHSVNVASEQIGLGTLEELYRATQSPILVDESITFPTKGGFETQTDTWKAYITAIPARELRALWSKHQARLLSPNIRDYLGVRKSESNINNGIKETARSDPSNFMIFNNGITAVVHSFRLHGRSKKITVDGFGIVNGGQTTGSIGTLSEAEASRLDDAWVQIRFVASSDKSIREKVVKFNNTQNKVEPTDFRSKDQVQGRLRKEFESIPATIYRGGRRGGTENAIRREKNLLPDKTASQALASFHGDPNLAYNHVGRIWENDDAYVRYFNHRTTAMHIVFCYSLLQALTTMRAELLQIPEEERTSAQAKNAKFFAMRGSIHLLIAAIGDSIETICMRPLADRFSIGFGVGVSPAAAIKIWDPVIRAVLPFSSRLTSAAERGLTSNQQVQTAISDFSDVLESVKDSHDATFKAFSKELQFG